MIGGTSDQKAWSQGRVDLRKEYNELIAKERARGYAAPLGRQFDSLPLSLSDYGDKEIRRILTEVAWNEGQDKLRADLDARLAEVAQ